MFTHMKKPIEGKLNETSATHWCFHTKEFIVPLEIIIIKKEGVVATNFNCTILQHYSFQTRCAHTNKICQAPKQKNEVQDEA